MQSVASSGYFNAGLMKYEVALVAAQTSALFSSIYCDSWFSAQHIQLTHTTSRKDCRFT